MDYGAFSDFHTIKMGFQVDQPKAEYIPLMVSGLTAALVRVTFQIKRSILNLLFYVAEDVYPMFSTSSKRCGCI